MVTITLANAKKMLAPVNVTLTKKDGEYRVNVKGAGEPTAYYTDDIVDAVRTGLSMAIRDAAVVEAILA